MEQLFKAGDFVRSLANGQIYVIQVFTSSYETLGPSYVGRHIDNTTTVLLSPSELRSLEPLEMLAIADRIEAQMIMLDETVKRLREVGRGR